MHVGPVDDSTGTFSDAELMHDPCPKCGGLVNGRLWTANDGGAEDERFDCQDCGYYWWIEGIDS